MQKWAGCGRAILALLVGVNGCGGPARQSGAHDSVVGSGGSGNRDEATPASAGWPGTAGESDRSPAHRGGTRGSGGVEQRGSSGAGNGSHEDSQRTVAGSAGLEEATTEDPPPRSGEHDGAQAGQSSSAGAIGGFWAESGGFAETGGTGYEGTSGGATSHAGAAGLADLGGTGTAGCAGSGAANPAGGLGGQASTAGAGGTDPASTGNGGSSGQQPACGGADQLWCAADGACLTSADLCNDNADCSDGSDEEPALCSGRCEQAGKVWCAADGTCLGLESGYWSERQMLVASDGQANDLFGWSLSVSGDTLLVGSDSELGSAYRFTRDGSTWTEQQKITAPETGWNGFSGQLALSGDTALLGTSYHPDLYDAGSVYVYAPSQGVWTLQQKLTASDAATSERFGASIALSGDTALIGAIYQDMNIQAGPGSMYVFVRRNGTWHEQQKFTAHDPTPFGAFGWSVALEDGTALVGAVGDNEAAEHTGAVYVFTDDGGVWTEQQKIMADDAQPGDGFGYSVALSGDTALVAAAQDDDGGDGSGSAYVFTRSGGIWTLQQKLTASDAGPNAFFGYSVAVSGNVAIIGAPEDDAGGFSAGAAYVFVRLGNTWTELQKLTASNAAGARFFGNVALGGSTLVIGAWFNGDQGTDPGYAYVFELDTSSACPAP
jgi:hypothetical protein